MKPRLLFLAQCLPYPPHSGVTKRTYHVLEELRRDYDITLLAFSRRAHQPDSRARLGATTTLRAMLADVGEPVRIRAERSGLDKAWVHLRSLLRGRAYTYYDYGDPLFERQLRARVASGVYELAHIDSLDLFRWVDSLPHVPIACTHHNMESRLLRRTARHARSRLASRYLDYQAGLLEGVEREWCPRFDLNVVTSSVDAASLRNIAPGSRTLVVPNGVDVDSLAPDPRVPLVSGRVVFIGGAVSFPNRDGVEFFLRDIWPAIRERSDAATFHVLGRADDAHKQEFEREPGVACLGYVDDMRPHLAEAECSVVPLRVGGGTRLKILDAWAMGKAVVSTSLGCEGLEVRDGENILIRDDPLEFAEAVSRVLGEPALRDRLGEAARETVVELYSWDVIGRTLRGAYADLL